MSYNKLFEIATNISTPLALAGVLATILFFVIKQIFNLNLLPKVTKGDSGRITMLTIDRLFYLSLASMILGFLGFVIKENPIKPNDHINQKVKVKGAVFLDGKPTKDIALRFIEIEKEVETNRFGNFEFFIEQEQPVGSHTIEVEYSNLIDTTVSIASSDNLSNIRLIFFSKARVSPVNVVNENTVREKRPDYIVLSGKVACKGASLKGVLVSNISHTFETRTDENGVFALKSNQSINEGQWVFTFEKEGYKTFQDYFYVGTENLIVNLEVE